MNDCSVKFSPLSLAKSTVLPIYEYQCRACDHELETIQKMNDPKLTDCPECGKSELFRKISAVAFRLKGSGWYETDFKSDNKRQLHDDGKSESGGSSEKSGNSSDKSGNDTKSSSETKSSSGDSKSESTSTSKKDSSKSTSNSKAA